MTAKTLSPQPLTDPTAEIEDCTLSRCTEVGARTKLLEVAMADYSYVVNDSDIAYAAIGPSRVKPSEHLSARIQTISSAPAISRDSQPISACPGCVACQAV